MDCKALQLNDNFDWDLHDTFEKISVYDFFLHKEASILATIKDDKQSGSSLVIIQTNPKYIVNFADYFGKSFFLTIKESTCLPFKILVKKIFFNKL